MLKFEIHKADGLVATDSIMNKPFPLKSNTYLFRNNFFLVKLRKVPVTLFLFEGCIVITQRNQVIIDDIFIAYRHIGLKIIIKY